MHTPVEIRTSDQQAAAELIEATYDYLEVNPDPEASPGENISLSGGCIYVADAVKQCAASLGIMASIEIHYGHVVPVFSDESKPPTPSDPILCLTWGQFLPTRQKDELKDVGVKPYFGERSGIRKLVGSHALRRIVTYNFAYAPWSMAWRYVKDDNTGEYLTVFKNKHYEGKLATLNAMGWP